MFTNIDFDFVLRMTNVSQRKGSPKLSVIFGNSWLYDSLLNHEAHSVTASHMKNYSQVFQLRTFLGQFPNLTLCGSFKASL